MLLSRWDKKPIARLFENFVCFTQFPSASSKFLYHTIILCSRFSLIEHKIKESFP